MPLLVVFALLSFALVLPVGARAQPRGGEGKGPTGAEPVGPRRFAEVERGLYAAGTFGAAILLKAPSAGGGAAPVLPGLSMGVALGYDVLESLQLEAYATGAQMSAPADYQGLGAPTDPRGDFTAVQFGARVRLSLLSLPDVQGVHRLFLGVQLGGGLLASEPASSLGGMGPSLSGGIGIRYHTRMRHFSVGFDLDAFYGLASGALGLVPQGSLAFTF